MTVTAQDLDPTEVWFRLDTTGGAPYSVDSEAPFTLTLNTRELAAGPHTIWAGADDGTYTVQKKLDLAFNIRPNVVVVQLDDLDQLGMPYWEAMPQAQALLADAGLTFENAFVTDPLCCPSRASSLTGRYPHNTGVYDNSSPDGGFAAFAAGAEARHARPHGCRSRGTPRRSSASTSTGTTRSAMACGRVGTSGSAWITGLWWNGYVYNANHNGVVEPYGWQPEDYQTDVLSGQTNTFIGAAESDDGRPFFVYLNPLAPHANIGTRSAASAQSLRRGAAADPDRTSTRPTSATSRPGSEKAIRW